MCRRAIQQYVLMVVFTAFTWQLHARTYTTAKSGNYTDAATWAIGIAPPATLADTDVVNVMSGHTVMLDASITIGTNATIHIMSNAAFLQQGNRYIHAHNALIEALGDMYIDSLSCTGATTIKTGTGNTIFQQLSSADSLYSLGVNPITVKQAFYLIGKINTTNILVDTNATIFMRGGTYVYPTTQNLLLPARYHVVYDSTGADVYTGQELTGDSLGNVTIDLRGNYSLLLTTSLHLQDTLFHKSGHIDPVGTVTMSFTGGADYMHTSGTIRGSYTSHYTTSLVLNTNHPLSSPLVFPELQDRIYFRKLIVNATGNSIDYKMNGSWSADTVSFINGRLDINDHIFTRHIFGFDSSKYVITERGGLLHMLRDTIPTLYPIGMYKHYMPATLANRNKNSSQMYHGIGVKKEVYDFPWVISGARPLVNAMWAVEFTDKNDLLDISVTWPAQLEKNGFNRNSCYLSVGELVYYGSTQPKWYARDWTLHATQPATQLPDGMYTAIRNSILITTNSDIALAVFDENTLTIPNIATNETISLYPNPVGNVLHIGNLNGTAQLSITNAAGMTVATQQVDKNHNTVNISALPAGMYLIRLKGESVDASGKIMKQ